LAKATAFSGEYKKALSLEKNAYNIFKEKLGAEDARTKDSSNWLSHITAQAVKSARIAAATAPLTKV
jgi:protein TIF31